VMHDDIIRADYSGEEDVDRAAGGRGVEAAGDLGDLLL